MIRNKRQPEENDMKIAIAADHGGFELKQKLIAHYSSLGVEVSLVNVRFILTTRAPSQSG